MSTLSIVAVSAFSVLFLLLLLASAGAVVYVHILLRRQIQSFTLIVHQLEIKLDSQHVRMEALVANVSGQKITEAVQQFTQLLPRQAATATRIERAVILFGELVKALTQEQAIPGGAIERAAASGLLPESYAPVEPGDPYVTRGRTATSDLEALAEESVENSIIGFDKEPE